MPERREEGHAALREWFDGFVEQDKLGFFVPKCACGWECFPCPDEETATRSGTP